MHIEIWSDFVCPFCYIGKRKFETALENFPHHNQVKVTFKSYQLDPNTPAYNGKSYYENLGKKFGSIDQAKQMTANILEQAKTVGMTFDFDHAKVANTFNAHRLNKLAEEQDLQKETSELLFRAHFIEGKDIGEIATLTSIAEEAGLDKDKTKQKLESETALHSEVQSDLDEAKEFGITGVPYFIVNRKYAISGAQPTEAFTQALEKVWEEEKQQSPLQDIFASSDSGDACGADGCDIP